MRDRKPRNDDLRGVRVVDAHDSLAILRGLHDALLDRERADRGGHVSAIAAPIHEGLAYGNLCEGVVDVGIGPAWRPNDANLRERGDPAADAVELPAIGVGRAHHLQEDRIPLLPIGRQVFLAEHDRLRRATPHESCAQARVMHSVLVPD